MTDHYLEISKRIKLTDAEREHLEYLQNEINKLYDDILENQKEMGKQNGST